MKNLKLILAIFAISITPILNAQAQGAYINKIKILPSNPTEEDTLLFTVEVIIVGIHIINRGFFNNGQNVRYEFCFGSSDNTGGTTIRDTLALSQLVNGTYVYEAVVYRSSNGMTCNTIDSTVTTDSIYVATAVSLPEHQLLKKLRIYPNPAKDYLFVESLDDLEVNEIEIWDIQGKLVKTKSAAELRKIKNP